MSFYKYASDAEIVADYMPDVDLTVEADAQVVARRNEAASAFVDSYCRRRLGYFLPAPSTATPLRIRGENKNFLRLPVHIPGSVSVSGVASSAYYESPKNAWLYVNQNGVESLDDYVSDFARFWSSGQTYVVSARWGFTQTPAEIIEAVKMIVALWFGRGRGVLGTVSPNGFVIERDAPPPAKLLLQSFIKGEFEID